MKRAYEIATGLVMVAVPVGFVFLCVALSEGHLRWEVGRPLVDWLVAIGTLFLAITAVFLPTVQRWFYRARLVVCLRDKLPDMVMVPLTHRGAGVTVAHALYIRLWIENDGNVPASDVEVYAQELRQLKDTGWERVPSFPPMNLTWSNVGGATYKLIAPKMGKHCDLASIEEPVGSVGRLKFEFIVQPNHFGNVILPGRYQALLKVGASNVDPADWVVDIEFDGDWAISEVAMIEERHLKLAVRPA